MDLTFQLYNQWVYSSVRSQAAKRVKYIAVESASAVTFLAREGATIR